MTMIEVFIGANSLALVAGVLILWRLASRIGGAADEVGQAARRVTEIAPSARALIETGREELESLRSLTRTTNAVAQDVQSVSGQASTITSHLLRGFESEIFNRYRAALVGARVGIGILRRFRGVNGSRKSPQMEMERFDHTKA